MYNPVDILLDYILSYPMEDGSQVDYAIASDLHLYQLFVSTASAHIIKI